MLGFEHLSAPGSRVAEITIVLVTRPKMLTSTRLTVSAIFYLLPEINTSSCSMCNKAHEDTVLFWHTHTQKTHCCFCKFPMTTYKVYSVFSSCSLNFFDGLQRIAGLLSDLTWRQRSNKMFEVSVQVISSTKSDLGLVRLNAHLTAQLFLWKPSALGQMV